MEKNCKRERKSFKVIVLGEAGVGKTSLIRRYTRGYFSHETTTTVGVDRIPINITVDDDRLSFQVLDTAGCFGFHGLIKSYVNNIDAVIFVYDITNKESFACLPLWSSIMKHSRNDLVQILVGNKRDLADHREVNYKNAKNYADFEGMVAMEISVKEEESVDLVFQSAARELRLKSEISRLKGNQEENISGWSSPSKAISKSNDMLEKDKESAPKQLIRRFSSVFRSSKKIKNSQSETSLSSKQVLYNFSTADYMKTDYFRFI